MYIDFTPIFGIILNHICQMQILYTQFLMKDRYYDTHKINFPCILRLDP